MLFKQIDEILSGKKTQTRRVVKEGELADYFDNYPDADIVAVLDRNGRIKWSMFRDYAIQPGRGKGGIYARMAMSGKYEWQTTQPDGNGGAQWKPMRIRITAIRRERLQAISEADAQAEGVASVAEYRALWERINGAGSWDKAGDVWVLTFELVKGGDV